MSTSKKWSKHFNTIVNLKLSIWTHQNSSNRLILYTLYYKGEKTYSFYEGISILKTGLYL